MRSILMLAMTAALLSSIDAFSAEASRPLTATAYTLYGSADEERREVTRPDKKWNVAELRRANALGGVGATMLAVGALGVFFSSLALANLDIHDDQFGATAVGFLVSSGLLVTGGIFMAVGYGRAAHLRKRLKGQITLVPAPRPGGASLQIVARW